MAAFKELFGVNVCGKDGAVISSESLQENDIVGIYFSAHWCPPCRGFTPDLAECYKKVTDGRKIEIVFVSSDRDKSSFDDYYKDMPWLCVPFEDRDTKGKLSEKYGVSGIPCLVLLNKSGDMITKDGRGLVMKDLTGGALPWSG